MFSLTYIAKWTSFVRGISLMYIAYKLRESAQPQKIPAWTRWGEKRVPSATESPVSRNLRYALNLGSHRKRPIMHGDFFSFQNYYVELAYIFLFPAINARAERTKRAESVEMTSLSSREQREKITKYKTEKKTKLKEM